MRLHIWWLLGVIAMHTCFPEKCRCSEVILVTLRPICNYTWCIVQQKTLWARNDSPQIGPKRTAFSPFFCHPFTPSFFLFPSFRFLLLSHSLINHFFLSSPLPSLTFFLLLPPFHPRLSSPYASPSFLTIPCCLDDHLTHCMQSDERLKQKQCKGEDGGNEGEENEKLVPVTAFSKEASLFLFVKTSSLGHSHLPWTLSV